MWIFLSSACSAVLQGSSADVWQYVAHTVSTTVKSHAKDFPPLYGNVVMPSGLFLSVAKSPLGSQMAANSAVVKAFWMRLLAWLCLAFLLIAALLQLKPCLPNRSTVVVVFLQSQFYCENVPKQIDGTYHPSAQCTLGLYHYDFCHRD